MKASNDINRILEKLENLEDEVLAVELLKEFNSASTHLGKLLLNLDPKLSHDEWKKLCDQAQLRLDQVVSKIDQN
jgi:divalent metal cation (Fe/Co/Zn/Cd) transporter